MFKKDRNMCKRCAAENARQWQQKYPDRKRASQAAWTAKNEAALKDKRRAYYEENKESLKKANAEWRAANAERMREYRKAWLVLNPTVAKEVRRKYKERKRLDPMFRLSSAMASGIRKSIYGGKGGREWEGLVGYSFSQLKHHLEKQFLPGMSWDNYGEWHIDHIIPISAFNFTSPKHIDFQRCWSLKNLQPMWAMDNIKKGATLEGTFQPSLAF